MRTFFLGARPCLDFSPSRHEQHRTRIGSIRRPGSARILAAALRRTGAGVSLELEHLFSLPLLVRFAADDNDNKCRRIAEKQARARLAVEASTRSPLWNRWRDFALIHLTKNEHGHIAAYWAYARECEYWATICTTSRIAKSF